MDETHTIQPPAGTHDMVGARRVCTEFYELYSPTFQQIEQYLNDAMQEMEPIYAAAYQPWQRALKDLLRGVYLTAKKIPLTDPDAFIDAIRMFSFGSAIQFLRDLCVSCKLALEADWAEHFREHIDLLLFSVSLLNYQQQGLVR